MRWVCGLFQGHFSDVLMRTVHLCVVVPYSGMQAAEAGTVSEMHPMPRALPLVLQPALLRSSGEQTEPAGLTPSTLLFPPQASLLIPFIPPLLGLHCSSVLSRPPSKKPGRVSAQAWAFSFPPCFAQDGHPGSLPAPLGSQQAGSIQNQCTAGEACFPPAWRATKHCYLHKPVPRRSCARCSPFTTEGLRTLWWQNSARLEGGDWPALSALLAGPGGWFPQPPPASPSSKRPSS